MIAEHVNYIGHLLSNSLQHSVYFIDQKHQLTFKSHATELIEINSLNTSLLFEKKSLIPTIKALFPNEHYLCQLYQVNEEIIGAYVLGPIDYQKNHFTQILHQAQLIYYVIYHHPISFTDVLEENFYLEESVNSIDLKLQTDFSAIRQIAGDSSSFIPLTYEKQILTAIQYGDQNLLLETLNHFTVNQHLIPPLQEDPIRSSKTLYMTLIILGARAAIRGGILPDIAHKITISYLEQMEKSSDLHHLQQLKMTSLLDFTNRVKKLNDFTLSRPVTDTILFILKNLYENISLNQIANELHFSSSYLARLFKKEMQMTVGEFILNEKIEEAKRLLIMSNHSLLDISVLLHFNDQSHFTKVFKRVVGMTPKKYRDQYKLPT